MIPRKCQRKTPFQHTVSGSIVPHPCIPTSDGPALGIGNFADIRWAWGSIMRADPYIFRISINSYNIFRFYINSYNFFGTNINSYSLFKIIPTSFLGST